jgi:radical SAM superfamily enzyme YgiQ (UPF0313 family)
MPKPLFLFVYPEVPDTYWSYKHALSFVGKRALMPPLGIATVAAMVPDTYECRIVDLNVEKLSTRLIQAAELVLVSAMIVQADSMREVIARCGQSGTAVAVGGPYITSCRESIEGVDYAILGEAEEVFPRFLADYAAGTPKAVYTCEGRPELSAVPIPRFELLKLRYYQTLPLQFSRGCPFDCEFCDIVHLFGHRTRTKSPEQFIAELDAVLATGFRGAIFIVDDNFIGNRRAVKALLRAVSAWQAEHGNPFLLSTEASIDLASDDELLDLMVGAGFNMVFVGIETPEAESLAAVGKLQNLKGDVVASVRKIQERGIEVTGGFIIGFDSDPPDIFDLQIDFVQQLAIPTAMVGLLMALPNTKLYDRLVREGRMLSEATGNNTHNSALNFVPKMPREVLETGYYRVLQTIYSPRRYFERCLEVLSRYPKNEQTQKLLGRVRAKEIYALVSSLVRQTFSRYGLAYLSYLIRGARRRPDLFVGLVTMAVQGCHYFTITRRVLRERRRAQRIAARSGIDTWGAARDRIDQLMPKPTIAN